MTDDVAAVRALERVHRLPFTVVVKSCGVAIRKVHSWKKRPLEAD